jgi:hypothetical protein
MPDQSTQEFFVGYLPIPREHRRFLIRIAAAAVILVVAIALFVAGGQGDPGNGSWEAQRLITIEGVVYAQPIPLLRVSDGNGAITTMFLVDQGKVGAEERIEGYHGKSVRISGHLLHRSDISMLEIQEGPEAVTSRALPASLQTQLKLPEPVLLHQVTLRGEIIDPKCYAGAMKPGDGKPHKACAALCLRGGIPPMFKVNDAVYLIVDAAGNKPTGNLLDEIIRFAGDRVEISGTSELLGELRLLRVSIGGIKRL